MPTPHLRVIKFRRRSLPVLSELNLKAMRDLISLPEYEQDFIRRMLDLFALGARETNRKDQRNIGKPVITIDGDDRPGA